MSIEPTFASVVTDGPLSDESVFTDDGGYRPRYMEPFPARATDGKDWHFSLAHVLAAASPFLQETPPSGIELDLAARVSLRNDGTEYCV